MNSFSCSEKITLLLILHRIEKLSRIKLFRMMTEKCFWPPPSFLRFSVLFMIIIAIFFKFFVNFYENAHFYPIFGQKIPFLRFSVSSMHSFWIIMWGTTVQIKKKTILKFDVRYEGKEREKYREIFTYHVRLELQEDLVVPIILPCLKIEPIEI